MPLASNSSFTSLSVSPSHFLFFIFRLLRLPPVFPKYLHNHTKSWAQRGGKKKVKSEMWFAPFCCCIDVLMLSRGKKMSIFLLYMSTLNSFHLVVLFLTLWSSSWMSSWKLKPQGLSNFGLVWGKKKQQHQKNNPNRAETLIQNVNKFLPATMITASVKRIWSLHTFCGAVHDKNLCKRTPSN